MTIRGTVVHLSERRLLPVATRRPTTAWVGRIAPLLPPAGDPRTAQTSRRGTKPQMPCSDQFRNASLPYRPTLAAAAFCNPIAPAHSCRDVRPLLPPTSPTIAVRVAPPFGPFPLRRDIFANIQGGFCTPSHYVL